MNEKVKISTSVNGPLIVKNLKQLTEANGNIFPLKKATVALCRCGESKNRPFCDGTHGKIGWKSEKLDGRQPRRVDSYAGKKITIHDDRGICSHAGFCTDGLPKVFRMATEPWIDADAETAEKIIETIRKCPSGALSYSIDGKLFNNYSEQPEVTITEDGPYFVKGTIELKDSDHPESKEHYALCRCGKSKNKPFCDGQHWYHKFRDEGKVKPIGLNADEKVANVQKLAETGKSENSAMSTLKEFPTLNSIVFKGAQLQKMVAHIKDITNCKPVGIKFASGRIEEDIEFALKAKPDFITIDCRGGATGSSPKFLKDNVGIPAIFVIRRARKYLDKVKSDVTLCITGGFRDSSDIAKAIAMGADAVALATTSLIAIGCIQAKVCHTGTCPAGIATQNEHLRELFDEEAAVVKFENFYSATNNELKVFARTNGVNDIHKLDVSDIVTDSSLVAEFTDIDHI